MDHSIGFGEKRQLFPTKIGENIKIVIITSTPETHFMITIFCDFCQFYAKTLAFFLKNNDRYDPLSAKFSSVLHQKRQFFRRFFLQKIFRKS
jgi:hypothetical protein